MDEALPGKAPPLAPGARIDRYELVVLVHEDDAGSVWVAREETAGATERLVRLRVLSATLAEDERFRVLLAQEVKLAAGVQHPNVAQVLGAGEAREPHAAHFVASEWVEGETLAELRAAATAKGTAIPPQIALRVLADACAGLHAAHLVRDRSGSLLNVVHGDVSPGSIVIGPNGAARVTDLGVMKARARHAGTANLAWIAGGQAAQRVDRHADVWGIGAILAQTLGDAGGPGHGAAGADGTGPTVPSLVAELVLRARSSDPAERFATAAEMQGAIEAAMMTLGISATRGSVTAFVKELVGDRTAARAEAVRASRAKPPVDPALSIPTPAAESVPATAQTVRPESERLVVSTPPIAVTASAVSRTLAGAVEARRTPGHAPRGAKAALFAAGFLVAVLGSGVSAYLAVRARPLAAAPPATTSPVVAATAPPPKASCPAGTRPIAGATAASAALAPFCIDAALVTTEAYKACSDAGDCKRAATENRWPGITPHEQTAYDPLCHERDPKRHASEPANCIDRGMAVVYCEAHGGRLPSEAESAASPLEAVGAPISEWGLHPRDPETTRSYALGFRCARSL